MQKITGLDETEAALRVLLTLYEEGPLPRTKLIEKAPVGKQAIYTALKTLWKLKLAEEKRSEGFPGTVIDKLTKKGKRVAKKVMEIEELL
jgi:DNA-binding MarR family transcriptional regulator